MKTLPCLEFSKIVATGNDFLFVDARNLPAGPVHGATREQLAVDLCHRQFGAGADGLVFVESRPNSNVLRWDFYNSDGSKAEMCGNASRCMGRWAQKVMGLESVEFETTAGLVKASAVGDEIESNLVYVRLQFDEVDAIVDGTKVQAMLVNTGVPHVVVTVDSIKSAKARASLISAFRFHPSTGKNGANVTLLQVIEDRRFETVTFERGVEDFTLSCGTGVLAAAAVGLKSRNLPRGSEIAHASVITPGGELFVEFGASWQGAKLRGPANWVYKAVTA